MLSYFNSVAGTFRNINGFLTTEGLHRKDILDNIFGLEMVSTMTIQELFKIHPYPLNTSSVIKYNSDTNTETDHLYQDYETKKYGAEANLANIHECDVMMEDSLTADNFFHDYVKRSRPVIIKGVTKKWKAYEKWTNEYFRKQFGNESVHIKLTPGGDFEGIDNVKNWEGHETFKIPPTVWNQLLYPDLVVVRPAPAQMNFSTFLDIINMTATQRHKELSAYLEYTSISDYMDKLTNDLEEPQFAKDFLKQRQLNIWFSDGTTIGRIHFDAFDNLLCQVM